jgi:hypothetical protein
MTMNSLKISLGLALLTAGASVPALASHNDWRDRRTASPREVARSWDRVQDKRRDLARAQWIGDPRLIRAEARDVRRAEREFHRDRADLYRASWGGGWDDDRGRGRWDDDDRRHWNRRPPPHARGWGPGGRPKGWRPNDYRWQADGWNRPGWHAEHFYRPGNYGPRYLGPNDRIWRGYDNRFYCRRSDGTTGLIVGGLAGGTLGNVLAPGGSKLLGSVIGGTLGAVVGQGIDRNRVVCR